MILFWAWIYRTTGWYSPWARCAEYKAIKQMFCNEVGEEYAAVVIGLWQANNGFYRRWR